MTGIQGARPPAARVDSKEALCIGCGIRRTIGEPRSSAVWPAELRAHRLTRKQIDLLLMAAREFVELSVEAGEAPDPVAFIDWLTPEVLGQVA